MPDASHGCADSFHDLWAFRLDSYRDSDAHVIALAGELDDRTIDAVELHRARPPRARVHRLQRTADHRQGPPHCHAGHLIIVKGPAHVHRVFEICNLVRVLPLVDKFPHDLVVTLDNGAPPCC